MQSALSADFGNTAAGSGQSGIRALRSAQSTGPFYNHAPKHVEENRGIRQLERQCSDLASEIYNRPVRPQSSPAQRRGRMNMSNFDTVNDGVFPDLFPERWSPKYIPYSADQRFYSYINDEELMRQSMRAKASRQVPIRAKSRS